MAARKKNIEKEIVSPVIKSEVKSDFSKIVSGTFTKYNVPVFTEFTGGKWINCGADNLYPQYLVERLNKSSTHNAIVAMKTKQIAGEGLTIQDSPDEIQRQSINSFLYNEHENINDVVRKIAFDQTVFGYWCLGVIWSQDRTRVARIFHFDASTIRIGEPNKEGKIDHYWYCEDWRTRKHSPVRIAAFNCNDRTEAQQLLFVKKYRPTNTKFYSLPEYVPALNMIELEFELGNFQLNSVKKGLAPSIHVALNNGQPPEEEQEYIYRQFEKMYLGSDATRFLLSFNQSKETEPHITPIEASNLHEIYAELASFIQSQIIIGHRLSSPVLIGVKTSGQLGSTNEYAQASEMFFNTVIAPEQIEIEEVLNKILRINGYTLEVIIKDSQPISYQFTESTLMQILTLDEMRKKIGYVPLENTNEIAINTVNGGAAPVNNAPESNGAATAPVDIAAQAKANLKGSVGGVQGILEIQKSVSEGITDYSAALAILDLIYGISHEDAVKILGTPKIVNPKVAPTFKTQMK